MSGFNMIEELELYTLDDTPIVEPKNENFNRERKSKSLFSKISLTENYGKGIAMFSSYKEKLCTSVKKLSDDVSIVSKKAVKKLEDAKKNLNIPEIIGQVTNPLLNKISGNNFQNSS